MSVVQPESESMSEATMTSVYIIELPPCTTQTISELLTSSTQTLDQPIISPLLHLPSDSGDDPSILSTQFPFPYDSSQIDGRGSHSAKSKPFREFQGLDGHIFSTEKISLDDNRTSKAYTPSKSYPIRVSLRDVLMVISGFVIHLFPQGLGNSYGVIYAYLGVQEQLTDYQMSWIGSLMTGMMGVGAFLGSFLTKAIGCRLTSVLGCLLTSLGFIISSLSTNIYLLYLSLGVMPGLGAALSQLAAVVFLTQHFDIGRPLALGIVATGGAVGMLSFPLLLSQGLETFAWRGAMLLFAGLSLNVLWSSWLLKPSAATTGIPEVRLTDKKKVSTFQVYLVFLQQPSFILFAISGVFNGLAVFIYGSYLPEYAKNAIPDVTSTEVAILVCGMGAGSFIGRILFCGLSMTSPRAPLLLYTLSLTLCGVFDAVVPFCVKYGTLIFNSTCQGMFMGGWTAIVSLVAVNIFGAESLSPILGMAFLLQGFGCVAGPPIANILVGWTSKIEVLFYFAASAYVISALFMVPLFKVKSHPYKTITTGVTASKVEITGNTNMAFAEGG